MATASLDQSPPHIVEIGAEGPLSTLWLAPIRVLGSAAPSLEHAYHMLKFWYPFPMTIPDGKFRERLAKTPDPMDVRALVYGPSAPKNTPWRTHWTDERRLCVMRDLLWEKFGNMSEAYEYLVATYQRGGNFRFVATWPTYNAFWGVGPDGRGRNYLGVLMRALWEQCCVLPPQCNVATPWISSWHEALFTATSVLPLVTLAPRDGSGRCNDDDDGGDDTDVPVSGSNSTVRRPARILLSNNCTFPRVRTCSNSF
jgi:predicted NAD-dependent protein-ADP-ribosyltransferase YbiA (DUF1768 family)